MSIFKAFSIVIYIGCTLLSGSAFALELHKFECSTPEENEKHPEGWRVNAKLKGQISEVSPNTFALTHKLNFEIFTEFYSEPSSQIWAKDSRQEWMIVNNPDYKPVKYKEFVQFHLDGQARLGGSPLAWGVYQLLMPKLPIAANSKDFKAQLILSSVNDHFGGSFSLACQWGTSSKLEDNIPKNLSASEQGSKLLKNIFGFKDINFNVDEDFYREIAVENRKIDFLHALFFATFNILNTQNRSEHPLNIAVHAQAYEWQTDLPEFLNERWRLYARVYLRKHLENSNTRFDLDNGKDEVGDSFLPHDGESIKANWVFRLAIPSLSDHIYWSVVDPQGQKQTYTYGFN
ncbi:MAG: hypothetical protein KBD78_10140 [Oligoflexales bacterium]|nr:hypothetical protein [Oligoflexales bacterium]